MEKPIGHAIAILKGANEEYLLFDPNLGVYTLKGIRKLIAALIILLSDGYDKRSVVLEDDWLLFAKTDRLVPPALIDYGQLLSAVHSKCDDALRDLIDYLKRQTQEAYQVVCRYLEASANDQKFAARSKEILAQYDSVLYGTREYSALEVASKSFQSEWNSASKERAELGSKALEHCQRVRAFLTR